ncbi:CsoS2 family carboxysome shell protein [Vulcanococcus limneticus]|uniref:carboxysome assembly protein CsoS2 n=1 Tax=Vulcanococcus limneticus TaxID=2170428 RepID=UPI00398BD9F8
MASTSSREAALERRKALTNGGKKATGRFTSSPSRVRSAADARPTRTNSPVPSQAEVIAASAPSASDPSRRRAGQPERVPRRSVELSSAQAGGHRSAAKPVANPSRELVLARREALSRGGKRADRSKDRSRTDAAKAALVAGSSPSASDPSRKEAGSHTCKCQEKSGESTTADRRSSARTASLSLGSGRAASSNGGTGRAATKKITAQHNPSRALVLARRDALAKKGKSASTSASSGSAAVVRQGNPDLSTRELAQKLRELKNKSGSAGIVRTGSGSGTTRPSGPNRKGAKQAAEASLKVGVSETLSGQVVTGTQANRSVKTTGNEAATCRTITGTEYLGAEVFQTFCQSQPSPAQPAKVRVSSTSHGNRVTGNEVGRSEKVTGDEPGTCKSITGTEYISANQAATWCGSSPAAAVRKVGRSQTQGGQAISGVLVGRSEKVTGDEPGSGLQLTGDQYLGREAPTPGQAPAKVASFNTLRGTGVTGTSVGRSERVTGDEPGSCRNVTGDEYLGSQQFDTFCGNRPAPEAPKVGFSVTNKNLVVSGTRTGRSEKVTGDEPGTCKAVTGTPYAGLEQTGQWCSSQQVQAVRERLPMAMAMANRRMTGIKPGVGGVMTGDERGACEEVTGTPYIGADQQAEACGRSTGSVAPDFPQPLNAAAWQQFSVQSPAREAQLERERTGAVTGSTYEQGGRITGPFDMAGGKVTGTEQFRFDRQAPQPLAVRPAVAAVVTADEDLRPASRVTGEGSGNKITGDDWDRGDRVTGTEGSSARRRNPTRVGPMSAMPAAQPKRNVEVAVPVSRVTGSSGSTDQGSLITVSGGARG